MSKSAVTLMAVRARPETGIAAMMQYEVLRIIAARIIAGVYF